MEKTTNFEKYQRKTIISIDYGTKNVGISVFTPGKDPFPLPHSQIKNTTVDSLLNELDQVIEEEFVDIIVLGLPTFTDGNESKMTQVVRDFSKELTKKYPQTPLFLQNEMLSSFEAEERMKNSPRYNFKVDKSKVDSLAAVIILEEWLQSY